MGIGLIDNNGHSFEVSFQTFKVLKTFKKLQKNSEMFILFQNVDFISQNVFKPISKIGLKIGV